MSEGVPAQPPAQPRQRTVRRRHDADPWPRFVPVLWLMGSLLLVNVALTIYVRIADDESPAGDCVATAVAAAIVTAFALHERRAIVRSLRVEQMTGHDWLWTGFAFVAIAVVVESWFWAASYLFDTLEMLAPFRTYGWPPWSAVVLVVLCPAVFEEIAFRGFLQERLTALMGSRDALLLQGALFAILHMAPVVLPSHFFIGLCLGWLRNRTRSLVPGMLVHGAWNLTVLLQEGLLLGW